MLININIILKEREREKSDSCKDSTWETVIESFQRDQQKQRQISKYPKVQLIAKGFILICSQKQCCFLAVADLCERLATFALCLRGTVVEI